MAYLIPRLGYNKLSYQNNMVAEHGQDPTPAENTYTSLDDVEKKHQAENMPESLGDLCMVDRPGLDIETRIQQEIINKGERHGGKHRSV